MTRINNNGKNIDQNLKTSIIKEFNKKLKYYKVNYSGLDFETLANLDHLTEFDEEEINNILEDFDFAVKEGKFYLNELNIDLINFQDIEEIESKIEKLLRVLLSYDTSTTLFGDSYVNTSIQFEKIKLVIDFLYNLWLELKYIDIQEEDFDL